MDVHFGENWFKNIKNKWNSMLKKNASESNTTTTRSPELMQNSTELPPSTTNSTEILEICTELPPTTTNSSQTLETNIFNVTENVTQTDSPPPEINSPSGVSTNSNQDARDGLEFFKIYNDFMLSKIASKLSENNQLRQPLTLNNEQNPTVESTRTTSKTSSPNLSKFNENDIKILKELNSCLLKKKAVSKLDDGKVDKEVNESLDKTDSVGSNDVALDTQGTYENIFF